MDCIYSQQRQRHFSGRDLLVDSDSPQLFGIATQTCERESGREGREGERERERGRETEGGREGGREREIALL